jgi:hypothetical protein
MDEVLDDSWLELEGEPGFGLVFVEGLFPIVNGCPIRGQISHPWNFRVRCGAECEHKRMMKAEG